MINEEIMYLKQKPERQSLIKLFYNSVTEFRIEHNCTEPFFFLFFLLTYLLTFRATVSTLNPFEA